jgi:hypothetical protein
MNPVGREMVHLEALIGKIAMQRVLERSYRLTEDGTEPCLLDRLMANKEVPLKRGAALLHELLEAGAGTPGHALSFCAMEVMSYLM